MTLSRSEGEVRGDFSTHTRAHPTEPDLIGCDQCASCHLTPTWCHFNIRFTLTGQDGMNRYGVFAMEAVTFPVFIRGMR